NPSLAGGAGGDTGGWDATRGALVASDTQTLFGAALPVASALATSTGFTAHSTGYSGTDSDGYRDLAAHHALANPYEAAAQGGSAVQPAQVPAAADTTFTLALGFGAGRAAAAATAAASLAAGFGAAESRYRAGWDAYVGGLAIPASVSTDTL